MEGTQKAKLEKYGVIGLVIVFALIFSRSLKQIGVFGARAPAAAEPAADQKKGADLSKPISQQFQEHWQRMDPDAALSVTSTPAVNGAEPAALGAPIYTAHNLRDPLQVLLPEPPAESDPAAQAAAQAEVALPPPPSPPALSVQGLWWGGAKPRAIINGNVYAVGDQVEGARIKAIDREGVMIEFDGTVVHLVPSAEGAKKDAPAPRASRQTS